jgi:parvulin-like peptidyl-prolyl isomerase
MKETLNFELAPRKEKTPRRQPPILTVLVLLLVLAVGVNIVLVLRQPGVTSHPNRAALSEDAQQQLALKLEKQGLSTAAAETWKEYLASADLSRKDAAMIWYRIGKLYQDNNAYEKALESYYRSESVETVDSISSDRAIRIQECLESMGKYAALRHELSERVDISSGADTSGVDGQGNQVVAEIGPQKITTADLDQRIEMSIDRQLSQFASTLPEEERNRQKEMLLKQFSTSANRLQFLNQFLAEEMLYRHARDSKLTDDQHVRDLISDQERSLLANLMLEKELNDQIHITSGDLTTYYEAHKADYIQPERVRIAHILVPNEQEAESVRKRLASGESFEDIAKELSEDTATRENGGEIQRWIERNSQGIPELGEVPGIIDLVFSTEAGSIVKQPITSDKGAHIVKVLKHEQESQKTFEDVKQEVYTALRSQKEQDVQHQLFENLKKKYDVVIHQSAFVPEKPGETDKKTN